MEQNWTILVVDADLRACQLVKDELETAGMTVLIGHDDQSGLALFKRHNCHLVICEAHLPNAADFSLVKQIKDLSNVPILVLSNLSHDAHRIQGFEWGIADYVVKPFSPREVMLRVRRLLVYFYDPSPFKKSGNYYVFPEMTVDLEQKQLEVELKKVHLTPREYQLLAYFIQHPNQVITRREFLTNVWGYHYFGDERSVDVQIRALRNKLKEYSSAAADRIRTERNRGYYFKT